MTDNSLDVAILGAGPYGSSLAAHLRRDGVEHRVFGEPMESWRRAMPMGMHLKSEGFASSLSDPDGALTLARYCAEHGHRYADQGEPVSLDGFVSYALAFQQRATPEIDRRRVLMVEPSASGYTLRLDDGETLSARNVVVATGLTHAAYVPPELQGLPAELLSHSSAHHDLAALPAQEVIVVGAGQSALETAALLHEAGKSVRVLVRRDEVSWVPPPDLAPRSLYARTRYPVSCLGGGMRSWLYSTFPHHFRILAPEVRKRIVATANGPAGAWWLRPRVEGRLPLLTGCRVAAAEARPDGVHLTVRHSGDDATTMRADHVVSATGYRYDLDALPFLAPLVTRSLRRIGAAPSLSRSFESSIAGLYFIGAPAAWTFGPLLRFVCGASHAAPRVAKHLAAGATRRPPRPVFGDEVSA